MSRMWTRSAVDGDSHPETDLGSSEYAADFPSRGSGLDPEEGAVSGSEFGLEGFDVMGFSDEAGRDSVFPETAEPALD